jgi:hypothetical protein
MIESGSPVKIDNTSGVITIKNSAGSADVIYKLPNVFRGITPTVSGWDTAPTTLGNITDGDLSTVTGTGSKNMGAAGDYGYVVFDLTTTKTVMVGGRVGVWNDGTQRVTKVFAESSDDNVTYRGPTGKNSGTGGLGYNQDQTTELIFDGAATILTGRYIRLRFWVSGAANTANAKIYEVYGYEMSL